MSGDQPNLARPSRSAGSLAGDSSSALSASMLPLFAAVCNSWKGPSPFSFLGGMTVRPYVSRLGFKPETPTCAPRSLPRKLRGVCATWAASPDCCSATSANTMDSGSVLQRSALREQLKTRSLDAEQARATRVHERPLSSNTKAPTRVHWDWVGTARRRLCEGRGLAASRMRRSIERIRAHRSRVSSR